MHFRRIGRMIVTLVALTGAWAHADERAPVSAFARLPDLESVRISPDGNTLAWIGSRDGLRAVQIHDLKSARYLEPITTIAKYKFRGLEWADDETLLVTVSFSRTLDRESVFRSADEFYRVMAFNTVSRQAIFLLADQEGQEYVFRSELHRARAEGVKGAVVSSWIRRVQPNCSDYGIGAVFYIPGSGSDCWHYALLDVDLRSGQGKLLEAGDHLTEEWFVDAKGLPAARMDWTRFKNGYRISVPENGGWKPIHELPDFFELEPAGILADGKALLGIGAQGGAKEKAWRIPLDGGEISLLHEGEADVESAIEDIHTGAVAGLRMGGFLQPVFWLDPRYASIQSAAERAFPAERVTVESRSGNYRRVVVRVESSTRAPTYFLIDFDRGAADMIGEAYPELAKTGLAPTQTISYPASDGRTIPAHLTRPSGSNAQIRPLVILLHDGLAGRDEAGFDWRVQFLASRGYAVFQPQYRGSSGFGADFRRAGRDQWGRAVQSDVTDGIAWLREQKLADTSRVCIVGEGFGGYIALAAAVLTPQLFSCVVGINGVSDLPSMYEYHDRGGSLRTDYWKDRIGQPRDYELLERSPIRSAELVRAPILLIASTADSRVPLTQTDKMERALRKQDKPHEVLMLEDEDHWLSQSESRQRLLEALESFLAESLGGSRP